MIFIKFYILRLLATSTNISTAILYKAGSFTRERLMSILRLQVATSPTRLQVINVLTMDLIWLFMLPIHNQQVSIRCDTVFMKINVNCWQRLQSLYHLVHNHYDTHWRHFGIVNMPVKEAHYNIFSKYNIWYRLSRRPASYCKPISVEGLVVLQH